MPVPATVGNINMEAVGFAASVAGLASLAIQLTDGVCKLRTFLRNTKDAPKNVARIILELEALSVSLGLISNDLQRGVGQPDAGRSYAIDGLKSCVDICQNGLGRTSNTVQNLEEAIKQKRWLDVAKATFRKREVDELCRELDSAKISLLLAHQMYERQVSLSLIVGWEV